MNKKRIKVQVKQKSDSSNMVPATSTNFHAQIVDSVKAMQSANAEAMQDLQRVMHRLEYTANICEKLLNVLSVATEVNV